MKNNSPDTFYSNKLDDDMGVQVSAYSVRLFSVQSRVPTTLILDLGSSISTFYLIDVIITGFELGLFYSGINI